MQKYGAQAQKKIKKVLREYTGGQLKSEEKAKK